MGSRTTIISILNLCLILFAPIAQSAVIGPKIVNTVKSKLVENDAINTKVLSALKLNASCKVLESYRDISPVRYDLPPLYISTVECKFHIKSGDTDIANLVLMAEGRGQSKETSLRDAEAILSKLIYDYAESLALTLSNSITLSELAINLEKLNNCCEALSIAHSPVEDIIKNTEKVLEEMSTSTGQVQQKEANRQ